MNDETQPRYGRIVDADTPNATMPVQKLAPDFTPALTPEQHQAEHIRLHVSLEALLSCYLAETSAEAVLTQPLEDFLRWSYERTIAPSPIGGHWTPSAPLCPGGRYVDEIGNQFLLVASGTSSEPGKLKLEESGSYWRRSNLGGVCRKIMSRLL